MMHSGNQSQRVRLLLSVERIWAMSLPFRLATRARAHGFSPGLRNLIRYEAKRFRHLLYERERLAYFLDRLHLSRIARRLR
jgi:imidazolonepropionase-like amidohydrolase